LPPTPGRRTVTQDLFKAVTMRIRAVAIAPIEQILSKILSK
jgi:hypothetical protein